MRSVMLFGSTSGLNLGPGGIGMANVKLWLKADALGLATGASVSSWTDSGPLAKHATQATGSLQPTFQTGVLNGKPCIRFDFTDDILTTAAIDLSDTPTLSVFSVFTCASGSARIIYETSAFADNNVGAFSAERRSTDDVRFKHRGNAGATIAMFIADDVVQTTTAHYLTAIFDFSQSAGSEITFYRDGVDRTANGTKVNTGVDNTDTGYGNYAMNIGNRSGGGVPSGADIFELIVLKGRDATERSFVHSYLKTKYGL